MEVKDSGKFILGLFLMLFSIVPFSYLNHAEKFKIENCKKINGTITKVEKIYRAKSQVQDGWMISLQDFNFKVRVVGEYYEAIKHDKFEHLIKPGTSIEVYLLKPEHYGMFEDLNNYLNIKDAATLICSGETILDLKNIREQLSHLFIMNLIFGIVVIGFGIAMIIRSIK